MRFRQKHKATHKHKHKHAPFSMKKTLSNMLDEVVDPKPDPAWNEYDELPPPTGESVRIIGLDMLRDNSLSCGAIEAADDGAADDQSLIEKCRENISYFVEEVMDPKPDPERYRGGDGDDDSLVERVSLILDQALFPEDDDDNHSIVSQAAMMVENVVEEIVDPKPDESYQTNDCLCSCLG